MRPYVTIFLVALVKVCFAVPRTTSAADKTNFSHRTEITKLLPERYFDAGRKPHTLGHFISNLKKANSLRSLDLQTSSRQDGVSGDKCSSNSDCSEGRTCQTVLGERCFLPGAAVKVCEKTSDCPPGERCFDEKEDSQNGCYSQDFADDINEVAKNNNAPNILSPVDDGNDPCIGAHLLSHLSRNQLVFEKDILSNVLCDQHNSCATPGHMVTYHGKGMMMKSYCEIIGGCVKKVMPVNSPRYSRKATVPSLSENMVFTAFSARYVTRAEEGMLAIAIRLGL